MEESWKGKQGKFSTKCSENSPFQPSFDQPNERRFSVVVACFHPLTGGRYPVATHGRTQLKFGDKITPGMEKLKVPCGQCIGCRLDKSLHWATRCMHESKFHHENSFITLTYEDENLPADMSVSLRAFQLFMKRLRKQTKKKLKVFHCGEYSPPRPRHIPGSTAHPDTVPDGLRPHYHAIIFGFSFPDKKLWSVRNDIPVYTSDFLADLWKEGFSTVGDVTFESAAYVARYTVKKLNGKMAEIPNKKTGLKHYERVCPITGNITEVAPEYATMSNGIGKEFAKKYISDLYPGDHVVINGHETRPPRYYDEIFEKMEPATMAAIRDRRCKAMQEHTADNTPARLRQREKVKLAQLKMLKRDEVQ